MGLNVEERNLALQKVVEILKGKEGRFLIVNDRSYAFDLLDGEWWNRFSIGERDGQVLPEGTFDHILLRIDINKDVMRHLAMICNSLADSETKIWLVGGNDEGIKPIASTLKGIFTSFDTVAIKQRSRLISAKRTENAETEVPLETLPIELYGDKMDWTVSPSAFAKGKLDKGTALLLEYLQENPFKRSLQLADFASGTGVLTWGLKHLYPEAEIDGIEADSWAMEAAKKNVSGVNWVLSDGWRKIGKERRYDVIVSNPPVHFGKEFDLSILEGLLLGAKARMHRRGYILLVLQSHIALTKLILRSKTEILVEKSGYRIWKVRL